MGMETSVLLVTRIGVVDRTCVPDQLDPISRISKLLTPLRNRPVSG
jgi:hypothetical protein